MSTSFQTKIVMTLSMTQCSHDIVSSKFNSLTQKEKFELLEDKLNATKLLVTQKDQHIKHRDMLVKRHQYEDKRLLSTLGEFLILPSHLYRDLLNINESSIL